MSSTADYRCQLFIVMTDSRVRISNNAAPYIHVLRPHSVPLFSEYIEHSPRNCYALYNLDRWRQGYTSVQAHLKPPPAIKPSL
jgi:hypothetical protein